MSKTDNEIFYAVGFKNKIIKAVSNGTYEFARNTVKYYRSIGYNAKIMTCEEFYIWQEVEHKQLTENRLLLTESI